MSNILHAMKMVAPSSRDVADRLQAVGVVEVHPAPEGGQVAEFENLANSLIHLADDLNQGAVLVFSSTARGEGASYVSFNCARYLKALSGKPVAWIDANFRHPHRKLRDNELTLSSLIENPERLKELRRSDQSLVLIGGGETPTKSIQRLRGPEYAALLGALKEGFAFTIVDAPPILDNVEVGHLAKGSMGVVLVVESCRLKHEIVSHAIEKIGNQNVEVLGTVLNRRRFQLPEFLYRRI